MCCQLSVTQHLVSVLLGWLVEHRDGLAGIYQIPQHVLACNSIPAHTFMCTCTSSHTSLPSLQAPWTQNCGECSEHWCAACCWHQLLACPRLPTWRPQAQQHWDWRLDQACRDQAPGLRPGQEGGALHLWTNPAVSTFLLHGPCLLTLPSSFPPSNLPPPPRPPDAVPPISLLPLSSLALSSSYINATSLPRRPVTSIFPPLTPPPPSLPP